MEPFSFFFLINTKQISIQLGQLYLGETAVPCSHCRPGILGWIRKDIWYCHSGAGLATGLPPGNAPLSAVNQWKSINQWRSAGEFWICSAIKQWSLWNDREGLLLVGNPALLWTEETHLLLWGWDSQGSHLPWNSYQLGHWLKDLSSSFSPPCTCSWPIWFVILQVPSAAYPQEGRRGTVEAEM